MKKILIFGTIIVLLVLIFALIFNLTKQMPPDVKIGYAGHSSGLPFFVAKEQKFFEKEGIKAEFIELGFMELMDALVAGKVDMISATSFPSLFGIEAEQSNFVKFFLAGGETKEGELIEGILVAKESPIKSLEGLKGKKVGSLSPIDMLNLKMILQKIGINPEKDVTLMLIDSKIAIDALSAKQVDALFVTEPYLTIGVEKANDTILMGNIRAQYINDPYWSGAAAVRNEFVLKNPEKMIKVFNALDKSIDFINNNNTEARKCLVQYTSLSQDIAEKTGLYFQTKTTADIDLDKIQQLADLLVSQKLLKKAIRVQDMYLSHGSLEK